MNIGDRIKALREEHGLTQQELGKIAGVSDKAVSTWEKGASIPRMGALQRVADHFGLRKSDLIEDASARYPAGLLPIEGRSVPLLGDIRCGEPTFAEESFESYAAVGANVRCDFALRARGDSMTGARIYDGDIVFIRAQPDVEDGQIAAVILDDDATLKRVYKLADGRRELRAENPRYAPILIGGGGETRTVKILGRAVAFQGDVH